MAVSPPRRAITDSDREAGMMFRAGRERAKLSLKEAAVRAEYSEDSIYRIERGEVWPPYASLQRLAAAYGIAVGDFFPNSGASAELEMAEPLFAAMRGMTERQQAELIRQLAGQVRMMRSFIRGAEAPAPAPPSPQPSPRPPLNEDGPDDEPGMIPLKGKS